MHKLFVFGHIEAADASVRRLVSLNIRWKNASHRIIRVSLPIQSFVEILNKEASYRKTSLFQFATKDGGLY